MNVVGLDLSLTSTGMAMFNDGLLADVGNVKTKGKRSDSLHERYDRLTRIEKDVLDFTLANDIGLPDLVVIEAPSFGSTGGSAHDRSGLWWDIVLNVFTWDIPIATVAPTTRAKYATGNGRSDKDTVLAHVIERYVREGTPRIVNDDQADAVALAAMGCRWLGEPVDEPLPEDNLKAMSGAHWPEKVA